MPIWLVFFILVAGCKTRIERRPISKVKSGVEQGDLNVGDGQNHDGTSEKEDTSSSAAEEDSKTKSTTNLLLTGNTLFPNTEAECGRYSPELKWQDGACVRKSFAELCAYYRSAGAVRGTDFSNIFYALFTQTQTSAAGCSALEAAVAKVTSLDLTGTGKDAVMKITWIGPLVYAKRLSSLVLSGNLISDIRPISDLPLTKLYIDGNATNSKVPLDISALKYLKKTLVELKIADNSIADSYELGSLSNLQILYASHTGNKNITNLASATSLRILDLSGNSLSDSDVSFLKKLTALEILFLADNQILTSLAFEGLERLVSLDLSNNSLSEVDKFARFVKLQKLFLDNNKLTAMDRLAGILKLDQLITLSLSGNMTAIDLAQLASLTHIEQLQINGKATALVTVKGFSGLSPELKRLSLQYCKLTLDEIPRLAAISSLAALDFSSCEGESGIDGKIAASLSAFSKIGAKWVKI